MEMPTIEVQSIDAVMIDGKAIPLIAALASYRAYAGEIQSALRVFFTGLTDQIERGNADAESERQQFAETLADALAGKSAAEENLKKRMDAQGELVARGKAAAEKIAAKLPPEVMEKLRDEIAELGGVIADGQKPVEVRKAEEALSFLTAARAAKAKEMEEIEAAIAEAEATIKNPSPAPPEIAPEAAMELAPEKA